MGQPWNPAVPASQSANQPTYTRADVEKRIAQKLKNEGHTRITREEFDRAVDDAFRRIQQYQAAQAPPPYSKTSTKQPDTTGTRGV
jgi:hypothetical protein